MTEIDLETGEPIPGPRRSKYRKTEEEKDKPKSRSTSRSRTTAKEKVETELESRLERIFTKLATILKDRGDDELGSAIEEETRPMTTGFISLTANLPILRNPFILFLSAVELFLAFGRVGTILFQRFIARRTRRAQEFAEAQQQYYAEHPEQAPDGFVLAG